MRTGLQLLGTLLLPTLVTAAPSGPIRTAAALADHLSKWESEDRAFDLTVRVDCRWCSDNTNSVSISVSDASGAIVVAGSGLDTSPAPGDTVRCQGTVRRLKSLRRPAARIRQLDILRHGPPPSPTPATIREILNGEHDYRFVRFSGVLRDARRSETSYPWALLTIGDGTSVLYASALVDKDGLDRFNDLIGAVISVEGASTPYNIGYRRQLGRSFKLTSLKTVRVLEASRAATDDLPDVGSIRDLGPEEVLLLDRHRAMGRVLAVWEQNRALLRTPDGDTIRLTFASSNRPPACGEFIEAIGYPETDFFNINLNHTTWRPACGNDAPKDSVRTASARDLVYDRNGNPQVNSDFHGQTVRMRGRVLGYTTSQRDSGRLYLMGDTTTVPVCLPAGVRPEELVDCTVEVLGVCVLESEDWRPNAIFPKLKGFLLVLRSSDDIRILSRPAWWTPSRLLAVIGTLLAALIAIFIWNLTLRRLATRKSRELFKEQLGHVKADLRTEERTRLAVELHDTLAQNLTGVSMEIEAANDLRGDAPKPMLDHLGIAAKALKSCRDELRNCLWDLRSQALEDPDMTKAVLKTLQPVVNDSRLAVRFNVPRARLSDNTAHALLRVIRELVVNAIRHGNATAVRVAGALDGDKLLCSVSDNGCGFDPDAAPGVLQGHFGLQGIRERIDEIGGAFEISSASGKGTRATITVPVPRGSQSRLKE